MQLIEELYGDDTDADLVQPEKVSPGDGLFKQVRFLTLFAIILCRFYRAAWNADAV